MFCCGFFVTPSEKMPSEKNVLAVKSPTKKSNCQKMMRQNKVDGEVFFVSKKTFDRVIKTRRKI